MNSAKNWKIAAATFAAAGVVTGIAGLTALTRPESQVAAANPAMQKVVVSTVLVCALATTISLAQVHKAKKINIYMTLGIIISGGGLYTITKQQPVAGWVMIAAGVGFLLRALSAARQTQHIKHDEQSAGQHPPTPPQ